MNCFDTHAEAVAVADFRASITRLRYHVWRDSANRIWSIRETVQPVSVDAS